jgi:hypothetical protein
MVHGILVDGHPPPGGEGVKILDLPLVTFRGRIGVESWVS